MSGSIELWPTAVLVVTEDVKLGGAFRGIEKLGFVVEVDPDDRFEHIFNGFTQLRTISVDDSRIDVRCAYLGRLAVAFGAGRRLNPSRVATAQNAEAYAFLASTAKPNMAKKMNAQMTGSHRVNSTETKKFGSLRQTIDGIFTTLEKLKCVSSQDIHGRSPTS
jgi:hypothetical protein